MRLTSTLLLVLATLVASAQQGRKELPTDSGLVVLHHFKNGAVSTTEWMDKDERWGRSIAYDQSGKELFSYQTRRIGGHATVHFSYHPNGGASKVEVSDAPDAGIQWYRSTTTYDEAGNQTGFTEQGRDNYGPITRPGRVDVRVTQQPEVTTAPAQEVVECQKMFVNELFVVNPTRKACRVVALAKRPSPALKGGTFTMAPGDTIRIGSYSMGEVFTEPSTEVDLDIFQVELGNTRKAVARYRVEHVQVSGEYRRHYVVIEGWTNSKKDPVISPSTQENEVPNPPRKRFRLRLN